MNSREPENVLGRFHSGRVTLVLVGLALLAPLQIFAGIPVIDVTRLAEMRRLYQQEMNKYNQLTDLVELELAKFNEMVRINEALGGRRSVEIEVEVDLDEGSIDENEALIQYFDREPKNQRLVQTFNALNRNRMKNRLFILKTREVARRSGSPLTVADRWRLNQEIEGMNNEILLQTVATYETVQTTRLELKNENLREKDRRVEMRRLKERIKRLSSK